MTELLSNAAGGPPTAPAAPPLDLARSTPGEYLRRLREEKGHTHAAVGSALHLTVHYIKALESDEYGKLPGLTFVKGYLRSYARFLGADVDNVLARFDEHITGLLDAGMHTARVERSRRRQDQALRWAIGAGFVVVAGLATGWWFMRDAEVPAVAIAPSSANETETTPASAPAPAAVAGAATFAPPPSSAAPMYTPMSQSDAARRALPGPFTGRQADSVAAPLGPVTTSVGADAGLSDAVAVPVLAGTVASNLLPGSTPTQPMDAMAATPPASGARQIALIGAGDDELKLSLRGNSWIEVDDGNMVRLYNDMLAAGDTLTIRGVAPFRVLLGDAAHVDISLNAKPVDFSADIRTDSTARLVLGAPASGQVQATPAEAASAAAPPASDEVPQ